MALPAALELAQIDGMAGAFRRYLAELEANPTTSSCCQNGSQINQSQQEKIWIAGSAICAVLGAAWTPLAGAMCEVAVPFLLDLSPI